jgi:hypothetical protein
MRLMISPVEADDGGALVSLYRWLSSDAAVASRGQVTVQAVRPQPGGMGGALDVISAVFSDAGAMAGVGSLLVAYRTWRDTRSQAPAFRIEKDDVTVVVYHGSEQEILDVLSVMFPESGAGGQLGAAEEEPGAR